MKMRECKKCREIKKIKDFYHHVRSGFMYKFTEPTWLCKVCANEIAEEVLRKEAEKYRPK